MLDPNLGEPEREGLAQEARGQIEAGGALKHENNWGLRKMAYEIDQRNEADYRWFRFEAPVELLGQLDHNLKIADGVLRFRIFKVDPERPGDRAAGGQRRAPPARAPPRRPATIAATTDDDSGAAAAAPRSLRRISVAGGRTRAARALRLVSRQAIQRSESCGSFERERGGRDGEPDP